MADANIRAVITAKDEASAVLKKFGDGASTIGAGIEKAAKVAAVALAAVGAAAVGFGVSSIKAFEESQNAIAQTNAVLASTKGIAGITADEVTKLAKALQKQTTFSDEDVRSVENLLLTFTAIGKDIFPQATKTVLNMATALGEDTKSASIQLGKALQDPILGITALRRVGVNFSDAQKDVIKNMVETGHKAEAQQAILKELETEFGNSAEAARHTFGGSLKALKNNLNDAQEAIGETITKALQPFILKASDFIASIDWEKVIKKTIQSIKDLGEAFRIIATGDFRKGIFGMQEDDPFIRVLIKIHDAIFDVKDVTVKLYQAIETYLMPKFKALKNTIENDVIPVLGRLWKEAIWPIVKALGPIVGEGLVWALGFAVDTLNAFMKVISAVVGWMLDNKGTVLAFAGAFAVLAGTIMIWDAINKMRVAFEVFRLVTIPNLMTSLTELNVFLTGFGGFAVIAAAAVAAGILIVNAGNQAKKAWTDAQSAIDSASKSDDAVITKLQTLSKTGTPEQQQRAKIQLKNLAASGAFASGTNFAPGGTALVGEQGPELVNLPRGSQVIPNSQVNNAPVNISVNVGVYAGTQMELRKLAAKLHSAYQDAQAMGTV